MFLALHYVDVSYSTSLIKTRAQLVQIIWEILNVSVEYFFLRTQSSLHICFHFRRTSAATCSLFNFYLSSIVSPDRQEMHDQTTNDDYWRLSGERNENFVDFCRCTIHLWREGKVGEKRRKVHQPNWRLIFVEFLLQLKLILAYNSALLNSGVLNDLTQESRVKRSYVVPNLMQFQLNNEKVQPDWKIMLRKLVFDLISLVNLCIFISQPLLISRISFSQVTSWWY